MMAYPGSDSDDTVASVSTTAATEEQPNHDLENSTLSSRTMRKGMVLRKSLSNGDVQQQKTRRDNDRVAAWFRKMAAPVAQTLKREKSNKRFLPWRQQPQQTASSHCHCICGQPPEIEALDALFLPRFQHYSPRQGLIFVCNGFINDMYNAPVKHEPSKDLIRQLFFRKPDGCIELRPCKGNHSRLAANLSAGLIGDILECLEMLKNNLVRSGNRHHPQMIQEDMSQRLAAMIGMHNDYKWVRKQLEENVHKAQIGIISAENKENSQEFEHHHHHPPRPRLTVVMAKQNLRNAQDALKHESEERVKLANMLAASFLVHELGYGTSDLPKFTTIAILLAYMWQKYHCDLELFEGYIKAMSRLGALSCSLGEALTVIRAPPASLTMDPRASSSATTTPSSSRSIRQRSRKASMESRKRTSTRPPRAPAA